MNLKRLPGGLKAKQGKVPAVVPRDASLAVDATPTATENNAIAALVDRPLIPQGETGNTNQVSPTETRITNLTIDDHATQPMVLFPKPLSWDVTPSWIDDTDFDPALIPIPKPPRQVVDYAAQPSLYPLTQKLYSQVTWYRIEVANWPPFLSAPVFNPFEEKEHNAPDTPSNTASPESVKLSPASPSDGLVAITTAIDEVPPSSACCHYAYGPPQLDNEYIQKSPAATVAQPQKRYGRPRGPRPRPETRDERDHRLAAVGPPPGLPPPRKTTPVTSTSNSLTILPETREERARRLKDVGPPPGLPPPRRSIVTAGIASVAETREDRERWLAAVGPPPGLHPPRRRELTTSDFISLNVVSRTGEERALRLTDVGPTPGLPTPPARRSLAMNTRFTTIRETPAQRARRLKDIISPPPTLLREQVVSEFGVGGDGTAACVRRRGAKSCYH